MRTHPFLLVGTASALALLCACEPAEVEEEEIVPAPCVDFFPEQALHPESAAGRGSGVRNYAPPGGLWWLEGSFEVLHLALDTNTSVTRELAPFIRTASAMAVRVPDDMPLGTAWQVEELFPVDVYVEENDDVALNDDELRIEFESRGELDVTPSYCGTRPPSHEDEYFAFRAAFPADKAHLALLDAWILGPGEDLPDETEPRAVDTMSLGNMHPVAPRFLDGDTIHLSPEDSLAGGAVFVRLRDALTGAVGETVDVRF